MLLDGVSSTIIGGLLLHIRSNTVHYMHKSSGGCQGDPISASSLLYYISAKAQGALLSLYEGP